MASNRYLVEINIGKFESDSITEDEAQLASLLEPLYAGLQNFRLIKGDADADGSAEAHFIWEEEGDSARDVNERVRPILELLEPVFARLDCEELPGGGARFTSNSLRTVEIRRIKTFKLILTRVDGEFFSCFVRFDPVTRKPVYTDEE
jgi:hypothetical protein